MNDYFVQALVAHLCTSFAVRHCDGVGNQGRLEKERENLIMDNKKIHRNKHPTTKLTDLDNLEKRKLMNGVRYAGRETVDPKWLEALRDWLTKHQYQREVVMIIVAIFLVLIGVIFFAAQMFPLAALFGALGVVVALTSKR